ncbi:MAG: dTDP-4-dehydrorhamnose 3,5-epimerase [Rhodospirillales bacterium]
MKRTDLSLAGACLVELDVFGDRRGSFAETYSTQKLAVLGIADTFVLGARSVSTGTGVVRGLHFQAPPHAQAKLVRINRGRVLDVIVDLRHASASFGEHAAVELDEDVQRLLYIPAGFAHGFCTLSDHVEIDYKMSADYAPQHEHGILWSDSALGIRWPVSENDAVVSDRDAALPKLSELPEYF